jgi:hypothetical protein
MAYPCVRISSKSRHLVTISFSECQYFRFMPLNRQNRGLASAAAREGVEEERGSGRRRDDAHFVDDGGENNFLIDRLIDVL